MQRRDRFVKGNKKIGSGVKSRVYHWVMGQKNVVVKRNFCTPISCHCDRHRNCTCSQLTFATAISELCICKRLKNHPNVVELSYASMTSPLPYGLSPTEGNLIDDKLFFVFPYANGGDLLNFFRNNSSAIRFVHIQKILVDILLGVEFTHKNGIVHRDIKPGNILITCENSLLTAKIGDYGLAKDLIYQYGNSPGVVTFWYRAPEVCTGNYNTSIDIWSVGCVLYDMVSKMTRNLIGDQLQKDDDYLIVQNILNNLPYQPKDEDVRKLSTYFPLRSLSCSYVNRSLPIHPSLQEEMLMNERQKLQQLFSFMLALNPNERLTATQILDHEILSEYHEYIRAVRREQDSKRVGQSSVFNVVRGNCYRVGMDMACRIFMEKRYEKWYKHIILFHAIEVYERVISSAHKHYGSSLDEKIPEGTATLYFLTCVYFMTKYFATFNQNIPFSEISKEYCTAENLKIISESEISLIWNVLDFDLYRPTVYDLLINEIQQTTTGFPSEVDCASLIIFSVNLGHHGKTAQEAYNYWKKYRHHYDVHTGKLLRR